MIWFIYPPNISPIGFLALGGAFGTQHTFQLVFDLWDFKAFILLPWGIMVNVPIKLVCIHHPMLQDHTFEVIGL